MPVSAAPSTRPSAGLVRIGAPGGVVRQGLLHPRSTVGIWSCSLPRGAPVKRSSWRRLRRPAGSETLPEWRSFSRRG
jgi:hypothetical protein